MPYREEHVAKLREVADEYTFLQDLRPDDSPKGRGLKARFDALRRNATTEEWCRARDGRGGRIADIWR